MCSKLSSCQEMIACMQQIGHRFQQLLVLMCVQSTDSNSKERKTRPGPPLSHSTLRFGRTETGSSKQTFQRRLCMSELQIVRSCDIHCRISSRSKVAHHPSHLHCVVRNNYKLCDNQHAVRCIHPKPSCFALQCQNSRMSRKRERRTPN